LLANNEVPSHVPPELVVDFQFDSVPGADRDSVQASADAARKLPDIFFGLGVRRAGNAWVVTRHDLIREVYQDAETFSSQHNADFGALVGETWKMLPLEADPPHHANWRILLNPIFTPARMGALEAKIDGFASELVDNVLAKGEAEFVKDFADIFPVKIFLEMFGLPLEHTSQFVAWEYDLLHGTSIDANRNAAIAIVGYLRARIAERRARPADDIISYVAGAKIEGRPLTDDEVLGVCFLLYTAGLDTVANMLSFMFKHLAEHPADQQALRDNPALIPNAVEELLRAYPIIISGRELARDTEFHGVTMRKGDTIVLPTQLAGRDEREFPNPDHVDFKRENVSHITFAAGPHRCVGSHLARRELRIALEQWLTRVPPFRVKPGETPHTHGLGVLGVNRLPLVWDKAT